LANLTLTLPAGIPICSGKQVTFKAPCDCTDVQAIIINDVTYALVDSNKSEISSCGNLFCKDAYVSVLLDCENNLAYVHTGGGSGNSLLIKNINVPLDSFSAYTPDANIEEENLFNLGYKYKAVVAIENAKEVMIPDVTFSVSNLEASGVDIANQVNCCNGSIHIYATGIPNNDIKILTLELSWNEKVVNVSNILTPDDIGAISVNQKGVANGVATLDANGKLVQMPTAEDISTILEGTNIGAVKSVNGQIGEVILTPENIGAAPSNLYGTEELITGVSELADGVIYCMYE